MQRLTSELTRPPSRTTALLCCLLWLSAAWAVPFFQPRATLDSGGFIDLWALRRDVIAVEALKSNDPPLSEREAARVAREEKSCVTQAREQEARFDAARASFNAAWLPKLKTAIAKGDSAPPSGSDRPLQADLGRSPMPRPVTAVAETGRTNRRPRGGSFTPGTGR